jgi:hypothetical protein
MILELNVLDGRIGGIDVILFNPEVMASHDFVILEYFGIICREVMFKFWE